MAFMVGLGGMDLQRGGNILDMDGWRLRWRTDAGAGLVEGRCDGGCYRTYHGVVLASEIRFRTTESWNAE